MARDIYAHETWTKVISLTKVGPMTFGDAELDLCDISKTIIGPVFLVTERKWSPFHKIWLWPLVTPNLTLAIMGMESDICALGTWNQVVIDLETLTPWPLMLSNLTFAISFGEKEMCSWNLDRNDSPWPMVTPNYTFARFTIRTSLTPWPFVTPILTFVISLYQWRYALDIWIRVIADITVTFYWNWVTYTKLSVSVCAGVDVCNTLELVHCDLLYWSDPLSNCFFKVSDQ